MALLPPSACARLVVLKSLSDASLLSVWILVVFHVFLHTPCVVWGSLLTLAPSQLEVCARRTISLESIVISMVWFASSKEEDGRG